MKKFSKLQRIVIIAALLTLSVIAFAAIRPNLPLPVTWSSPSGANAFTLDTAAVPVVTVTGTNYTGVTTNVTLNTTNVLKMVNGIVVSVN